VYGTNDPKGGCVETKTADEVRTCNGIDIFHVLITENITKPAYNAIPSVDSWDHFDVSYRYVGIIQSFNDHLPMFFPFFVVYLRPPVMFKGGSCHRHQTECCK
jgi:hypothetical protein